MATVRATARTISLWPGIMRSCNSSPAEARTVAANCLGPGVVGKRAAGDNHGGRGVGLDQLCGDGAQLAGALVQNGADGGGSRLLGVGKRGYFTPS